MPSHEPLTLGLLPEKKLDWRTFVFSYTASCVLILILLMARLIWPDRLTILHQYGVVELIPRPDLKPRPALKTRPKIAHVIPPAPAVTPKLLVPREIVRSKHEEVKLQPPRLQPANFDAPKLQASRPMVPKALYVGSFSAPQPATVNHTRESLKMAGFADPAEPPSRTPKLTSATLGSFDQPAQGSRPGRSSVPSAGMPRTAGFGDSSAAVSRTQGSRSPEQVQTAGFEAQQVRSGSTRPNSDQQPALTAQVEILFKPNPVYTEEARKLSLQGEVLLEVEFLATGELHVKRVVHGLGHGLDEAAIAAANKIKFKPAQQNGTPVDSTAIVHVSFQLAS
jgi:TonB family protein